MHGSKCTREIIGSKCTSEKLLLVAAGQQPLALKSCTLSLSFSAALRRQRKLNETRHCPRPAPVEALTIPTQTGKRTQLTYGTGVRIIAWSKRPTGWTTWIKHIISKRRFVALGAVTGMRCSLARIMQAATHTPAAPSLRAAKIRRDVAPELELSAGVWPPKPAARPQDAQQLV